VSTSLDSPKRSTPPSGDPSKLYGYPPSWSRPAPKPDPIAKALYALQDVLAPDTALGRPMSIAGSLERIADGLFAIAEAIGETRKPK
jgi:hypothetical protein